MAGEPQPILHGVTAVDLRPGVIRYESALWETTALALHAGGEAVLVDPCISAAEIAAIAADMADRGLAVRGLLITHSDWDHVCGISAFPGAMQSGIAVAASTSRRKSTGYSVRQDGGYPLGAKALVPGP